uniref:Uncharacterized protein n=1 Tax=Ananas comosus var. bracteatus TaxID=296719 RepID=A0A6V7PJ12_ANACO|nr:unnamed protein product [Ananas comosus var. bracteatus]
MSEQRKETRITAEFGELRTRCLRALEFVVNVCRKRSHAVYNGGLIPTISGLLKSGSVTLRSKALEVLRIVAEENNENKEDIGVGDTIRTIVKFLLHEYIKERELAVALLCELSKSKSLCEKIGGVDGAILILVGLVSSKSENIVVVERAEHTLKNLEKCEKNIKQMAENGRLEPLLTKLLEVYHKVFGSESILVICHLFVKLVTAYTFAGNPAIDGFIPWRTHSRQRRKGPCGTNSRSYADNHYDDGTVQAREATLKALNQISSNESSASVLIEAGILPPLVRDLFAVGCGCLPTRLKEMSAGVLSNLVASGADLEAVPLDDGDQTLLSEDVVHNLLHLISNTGQRSSAGFFKSCNRYIGPFQEGLVRVLSRLTYCLAESEHIAFAKEYDLATVFAGLIEANGSDKVIIASAFALENLSQESKYLTAKPEPPKCTLLSCFSKPPSVSGLCRIHRGFCTAKESFCLSESRAVEKLIACLDHTNEKVVEAALAALCTLLDDTVDTNRTEIIQKRAVWAVERFLRIDDIAREVSGNQSVGSALVEAYRNGDYRTRQIAERALKHIERLPDFSAIAAQS